MQHINNWFAIYHNTMADAPQVFGFKTKEEADDAGSRFLEGYLETRSYDVVEGKFFTFADVELPHDAWGLSIYTAGGGYGNDYRQHIRVLFPEDSFADEKDRCYQKEEYRGGPNPCYEQVSLYKIVRRTAVRGCNVEVQAVRLY